MSNAIVPVVPKRNAVTGAGYPTALALGELAVNTTTGDVYLGADPGVVQIGVALAAGTLLTLGTGNGSTVAFTIAGGTGIDAGGYLVSVGGVDQPNGWTVAGTTLTFSEAPPTGAVVSVRAILKGIGSGGLGNATQLQGRDIATTAPTAGQFLMWSAANNQWEPTTLAGGSVTFDTEGTHYWRVPAYTRYARVQVTAGNGSSGTNGQGTTGEPGGYQNGANGTNGSGVAGTTGSSITFDGVTVSGGTAGQAGSVGYGGGGGGCVSEDGSGGYTGNTGNGSYAGEGGGGGSQTGGSGMGGIGHGGGTDGGNEQGPVGVGANGGGNGGQGYGSGGSGGGGGNGSGGGGGGGGYATSPGQGGQGGTGSGATGGGTGETLDTSHLFTAGALVPITISAGAGEASITITY